MPKPVIDYSKCKVCEACISACPVGIYVKKGNKVVIEKPGDCIGCKVCETQCPAGAIKVQD